MTNALLRSVAGLVAAALCACTGQPGEDAKETPLRVDKTFTTSATANTQFVEGDECITTFSFASSSNFTSNGVVSTGTQVGLIRSDGCEGTTLFFAEGPIPADLTVDEQSAHLVADATLRDQISNAVVAVHVDITWDRMKTGTSDMCTHRANQPGLKLTDHTTVEFDDAPATGVISADGVNFAVGPSEFSFVATGDTKTFTRS